MKQTLKVAFLSGSIYDNLYDTIPAWEQARGPRVEIVAKLPHPVLNERVKKDFDDGAAEYDLIPTHAKYAPSQPHFSARSTRISPLTNWRSFQLEWWNTMGIPHNIDVKRGDSLFPQG